MRQALLDLTVVREVALEYGEQLAQVRLGTEFVNQAQVGLHPLLFADQRRMLTEQAWREHDRVVGIHQHGYRRISLGEGLFLLLFSYAHYYAQDRT